MLRSLARCWHSRSVPGGSGDAAGSRRSCWLWLCFVCSFHSCLPPDTTTSYSAGPAVECGWSRYNWPHEILPNPFLLQTSYHRSYPYLPTAAVDRSAQLHLSYPKQDLQGFSIFYNIFNLKKSFPLRVPPDESPGGLCYLQRCWGHVKAEGKYFFLLSCVKPGTYHRPPFAGGNRAGSPEGTARALRRSEWVLRKQ